jgi:hypothetical protein
MDKLLSPVTRSAAHAFALSRIGVDLFEAGAFTSARDVFRLLVLERSGEPSGWYWLGRCHQELGQPDVARALFESAERAGRSPLFRALVRGIATEPRP